MSVHDREYWLGMTKGALIDQIESQQAALSAPLPNGENARDYAEKIYQIQSDYMGPDHDQYCINHLTFFIGSLLNAKPDPEPPKEKDDE